jgi:transcriptional regulator with XRE-family HTH domain
VSGEISLGSRIGFLRRRRGLSRQTLAALIGYSAEWLRQVEKDERTVNKLSTLLLLAKVLQVDDVADFIGIGTGQGRRDIAQVTEHAEVREALLRHHAPDRNSGRPHQVDLVRFRQQLEQSWSAWRDSPYRYSTTQRALPGLLAVTSVHPVPAGATAYSLFAHVHRLASSFLRQTGDVTLALLAAERGAAEAAQSGDTLTRVACAGGYAETMVRCGFVGAARQLCASLPRSLPARAAGERPDMIAVWGAIGLTAAEAAAVDSDHHAADGLLDEARAAAERLGENRDDLAFSFGPADVAIQAVRIAVILGRVRQALRLARAIDVAGMISPERRTRHYLTIARAHSQQRNPAAATFALLQAEDACPEEIRFSAEGRQVLRDLLRQDDASVRQELWRLAHRARII